MAPSRRSWRAISHQSFRLKASRSAWCPNKSSSTHQWSVCCIVVSIYLDTQRKQFRTTASVNCCFVFPLDQKASTHMFLTIWSSQVEIQGGTKGLVTHDDECDQQSRSAETRTFLVHENQWFDYSNVRNILWSRNFVPSNRESSRNQHKRERVLPQNVFRIIHPAVLLRML